MANNVLALSIDAGGLCSYETLEFEDEDLDFSMALRELIMNEFFSRDYWFGLSTEEYEMEATKQCYKPMTCRPGACAQCYKFTSGDFVDQVIDRINDPSTGWQYVFFAVDSGGIYQQLTVSK